MDDPDPDSDLDESTPRPVAGPYGSREGDEAVVYVYGYGDEGPQKPCRSADCMALTGCMSHPQF